MKTNIKMGINQRLGAGTLRIFRRCVQAGQCSAKRENIELRNSVKYEKLQIIQ